MSIRLGIDPPPAKSFCSHLVDYYTSIDGPADLLKGVQLSAQWAKAFPLTQDQLHTAESVRGSAGDAWAMLVWGKCARRGLELFQTSSGLFQACCSPERAEREAEISQLFGKTLLQGVDFLSPVSEGLDLLHKKSWVDLGKMAPWIYGCYEITSVISDGVDVRNQLSTLTQVQGARQGGLIVDEGALASLDQRARLCLVILVKDGASIALSVAGLLLALTGAAVEGSIVLTALLLFLSTLFLVTKIFAHFYEKVVVEQLGVIELPAARQPAASAIRA